MEDLRKNALELIERSKALLKEGKREEAINLAKEAFNVFIIYLTYKVNKSTEIPTIPPKVEIVNENDIELIERILKSAIKNNSK
ncbi:hypothetical protein BFU36_01355 [Sulfolobus sp. A20]|uniref:hypothetical protein n=1 Tax=Sulfolobaceae TaxID=118883 RepID=UPI000845DE9F|nr:MULTISPECIES: hypothetical protein [unclassified Sulfolobus]TRM77184.1 hypothetical protein DJ532_05615 [Sulfolobus sp. A20-N-F8]TRM77743.1 hypothetical protein DJ528_06040 [Sulfolobus sp. B5]TRM80920.1 hypothetical protein DJ524_05835 [Sulfolobus sp. D5]TRM87837.1 hypothetical protein DJ529_07225 [Sulfolobus sp. C3]TRN02571.1 hypothetical protein DJ527_03535 [Sulfolobus sp. F1]